MLKRLLLAALLLPGIANAQFNFVNGQVLTASQLTNAFAATLPLAGGTLTGPVGFASVGAATSTTGALQYLQGATGSVARSLTNKFQDTLNVRDFGAVCNGVASDDTALTNAFAALVPGLTLTIPAGTCTFSSAKVLPLISNGGISGAGSGQSTLLYTGANTTNDLITIGNGTTSLSGWNISGFTIQSTTKMTGGAALHLRRMQNGNVLSDVNAGAFGQSSINLFNGIWLDNVNIFKYRPFNIQVQNEGLQMNGSATSDEGSDIFLDDGVVSFSSVGYHVGGGQGGVYFGKVLAFDNNVNYRVDNGLVARKNREIFFSSEMVSDGNTNYGIDINDTLTSNSPITINGAIGSAGLFGSGGAGVNIYVQSWPNGRITIGAGQLYNATSDALRVDDATTVISVDPARHIFNNGGYGINATVADSNIYNAAQYMALNTSGNQSANVNTPTWANPVAVVNGGTGASTASAARTNLGAAASASPTFSGTSAFFGNLALFYTAPAQEAIQWSAGSNPRWQWSTDGTSETGSNTGSNLCLGAYADGGSFLGNYACFARATGAVSMSGSLTVGGTAVKGNLVGTTGSIGGSALAAGACSSGTVSVTGATTSMDAHATPVTYPGAPFQWNAYVSSAGTVTVSVCATIAGTPTASAYNVRVLQ